MENRTIPMKEKKKRKTRVYEIDLLRSLPLFLVLLYHFAFDISMLPVVLSNYIDVIVKYPALDDFVSFCYNIVNNDIILGFIAPFVGSCFLFIAGISTSFSRNNIRRGLLLTLGSLLVSSFTWLCIILMKNLFGEDIDLFITFGIIHLIAFSLLSYAILDWIIKKIFRHDIPSILILALGITVFFIGIMLRRGIQYRGDEIIWPYFYVYGDPITQIQEYGWTVLFESAIGRLGNTIDWWPIFPFAGVLYLGIAFGKALYPEPRSLFAKGNLKIFRPLCFIGRHTIWFYLLQQPVLILVLAIILYNMGFRI